MSDYRASGKRYGPILLATIRLVRATSMNTKEIREIKQTLVFTQRQRDILVGLLLGDGHLETLNNGRTYRLKVEHSEKQHDYLAWLHKEFREWIPGGIVEKRHREHRCVAFTTYSHGAFRFYGQQFYDRNGIKKIPDRIKSMLSPIGLAVWFMDDGSRKSSRHKTYILHTLAFTKQDLERAKIALKEKFGIQVMIHKQNGRGLRLYIPSASAQKFEAHVREWVTPFASMRHKLVNTHA